MQRRIIGSAPAVMQRVGLETGTLSAGWSPADPPKSPSILQLGHSNNETGSFTLEEIIDSLEIKEPAVLTISTNSEADFSCGLVDNPYSMSRGESGWYDINSIAEKLPDSWSCLIINCDDEVDGHYGIFEYPEILRKSGKIIVNEAQKTTQHSVALRISGYSNIP